MWPAAPNDVVLDVGRPPFRTPGTRITWSTANEWLRHAAKIHARRVSQHFYEVKNAHLAELARHPAWLAEQSSLDLLVVREYLHQNHRPTQGQRAGTAWQFVTEHINNTIARREQLRRDFDEVRREFAAEAARGDDDHGNDSAND